MKFKLAEVFKENKLIFVIGIIFIFLIYFFGIRPSQIIKDCSMAKRYVNNTYYTNKDYKEGVEKNKHEKLGDYIQCRNNSLLKGDEKISQSLSYSFTKSQYQTLSLEELTHLSLNGLSLQDFDVYFYNNNGYTISIVSLFNLKENKNKYPQCDFPQDFIQKTLTNYGYYYDSKASDEEYSFCLRKKGLNK